jgi:polyhydroxyalkanoate depolymerase
MPASILDCFPTLTYSLSAARLPLTASIAASEFFLRSANLGFDLTTGTMGTGFKMARQMTHLPGVAQATETGRWVGTLDKLWEKWLRLARQQTNKALDTYKQRRTGELEFIRLFTDPLPSQALTCVPDEHRLLLDLPSMRLWDLSQTSSHAIGNYCVVFAPRAGHHSNIAERAAMFMRDQGLTRMALVEQKCAEEVPLYVDGRRHREDFAGQVAQYRQILAFLKDQTGKPAHLVAVCQPGPLLMTTLILHPELGRTFGSAGAPMHTEAQSGFLTDFSRAMGPQFIDALLALFNRRVSADQAGKGREVFDGRLQVLGFYLLGLKQHLGNLQQLLSDLRNGNAGAADRQMTFYQWYNFAHHFPAGFIRDTFQKIFVGNELIRGTLRIGDRTVGVKDYPPGVPIWALGGKKDDIAPELQAVGHLPLIDAVPERDKLSLSCDGGHMALFRSERVLDAFYTKIAAFLLAHSDRV